MGGSNRPLIRSAATTPDRITTSASPAITPARWWNHAEAVAQLHALWMAWEEMTGHQGGPLGPANWHRDYLGPVMESLRDPAGPFGGCKTGSHRAKTPPAVDAFPINQ
ncbi:DUF4913 domain-containing protein [Micromonospora sp. NPDC003241]